MAVSLQRVLKQFENAVRDHEMMGAQHPDDHDDIIRSLENARARVFSVHDRLINEAVRKESDKTFIGKASGELRNV